MVCEIACSRSIDQNVIFVLDASNSIFPIDWDTENVFLQSLVWNSVETQSYVGIIVFNSGNIYSHAKKKQKKNKIKCEFS